MLPIDLFTQLVYDQVDYIDYKMQRERFDDIYSIDEKDIPYKKTQILFVDWACLFIALALS